MMAASRLNHVSGAFLAGALASAALLSGCGEHHAAPAQEPSVSGPRPDTLAGAPDQPALPPPADTAAPPPPPVAAPPERSGDKDVVYDLGPVVRPHDTMAPIPNPTEAPVRVHRRIEGHVAAAPVHARRRHMTVHASRAVHHATQSVGRAGRTPAQAPVHAAAQPHRAAPVPHAAPAAKPAPAVKPAPAPAVAKAPRPAQPREAVPLATAKPAAHSKSKSTKTKTKATASSERTAKLTALQAALKAALARSAVLSAPVLKADQPTDVTMTLPADFASVVRDEAGKQGLQDAAASVNMTALLSGDGYAVAPDETQSQPLTVGQPTEFHWTVTPQQGARGALRADVGADLLGGGDEALQIGFLTPSKPSGLHVSPRAWGAGLLVLLAVIVFAWLSRGRRTPARRRPHDISRPYDRPLDASSSRPNGDRET